MSDYWFLSHKFIYISNSRITPHQKLTLPNPQLRPSPSSLPAKNNNSTSISSLLNSLPSLPSFFPIFTSLAATSSLPVLKLPWRQLQSAHFNIFAVFSEFVRGEQMECGDVCSLGEALELAGE